MEEQRRSNPKAAQVRIESRSSGSYTGQRKHDLRIGAQPAYVDADRAADNETVIEPPRPGALREINEGRRSQRDTKRAMKSNASLAFVGILTFGTEAQAVFDALPRKVQREAFEDAARAVADRLHTTLVGLVIHRDETAPHAHFTLPAYDLDGQPLTKTVKRSTLSDLQDVVAAAFQKHAPEIERGRSVAERLQAGAVRADTIHKSVRQLHADLPAEIAAKRAEITEAEARMNALTAEEVEAAARVQEMRGRVLRLEEKETLTTAEVKRLATYRKRLEDRVEQLQTARQAAEAARDTAQAETETAREEAAQAAQERDAANAQADVARAKAARIAGALQVLAEEIAGETIGRGDQGQIVAHNPTGLKDGFPDLKPAVIASADAIAAKRRIEAEANADRQAALDALKEAQEARAEMFTLRDAMRKTATVLRLALNAVGLHMPTADRKKAEDVLKSAEALIPPEKPGDKSGGGSGRFSM